MTALSKRRLFSVRTLRCPLQLHRNGHTNFAADRWSIVWLVCIQGGKHSPCEHVADQSLRRKSSSKKVHAAFSDRPQYPELFDASWCSDLAMLLRTVLQVTNFEDARDSASYLSRVFISRNCLIIIALFAAHKQLVGLLRINLRGYAWGQVEAGAS